MTTNDTLYVTDNNGQRVAVLIGLERYRQLLEEIDAIRAYDDAKASGDEAIPFDEPTREIEANRKAG